ncbi:serine hydrolase [Ensifer adhaerens]|uniref:serine hydrolase domain-containing protein n=1 Tax=Ensifer adhaerens TaxID=106592 RepID=UPI0023A97DD9|nr:serine hydrolase [Ensifer adhaerens]WDZ75299.1 serine hydrolase [Ensifer adhaerens]
MRRMLRISGAALGLGVVALFGWLAIAPPELLKVGDGYAAKIVCSNVFIAKRDAQSVLADDVQAPGHPLLKLVKVAVEPERQMVTARILGFAAAGTAAYRPGAGCTSLPDGDGTSLLSIKTATSVAAPASETPWPEGEGAAIDPTLQKLIEDADLAGPGARAIAVIRDGRLVAETYGQGFDRSTPLLGWSMTKSITAALIGLRVAEGKMDVARAGLLPEWAGDKRASITLADLMGMQSGLEFNENYGDVTDVTRMLYLEKDMAGYAAAKPLTSDPSAKFSYSSGTSTLLSRIWMRTFDDPAEALAFPHDQLFAPLGMSSAVLETDASGTFVGSSYMYATAQDWARFAQFLLQDGVWKGRAMLPKDYVAFMRAPTKASGGKYGQGQVWLEENGVRAGSGSFPADAFWMLGHDGQAIMLVPSLKLAVVRLGLTPSRLGYDVQKLNAKIIEALD